MAQQQRFGFIDHFRGLIIVCMALDHASYYFNREWLSLDPLDPTFDTWAQALLRYIPYLCAPGFLMMNGAMVWWAFRRRRQKGASAWSARWDLIQRGLFLIAFQLVWVNASWGGFTRLRLDHYGIIACIGTSMLLQTLIITWPWWSHLLLAGAIFLVHPLLITIPYNLDGPAHIPFQMFIDAGDFNKYPVLPWFGVALVGSVMARFWFERWQRPDLLIRRSLMWGLLLMALGIGVRLLRGFGNILPYGDAGSWSFFFDQKYPPSLYFQLWWCGMSILFVGLFHLLDQRSHILDRIGLGTIGKVSLFYYGMHISLLAIVAKRFGLFYHEGGVAASYAGWVALLIAMFPLCMWYARIKQRSRAWIVRMV